MGSSRHLLMNLHNPETYADIVYLLLAQLTCLVLYCQARPLFHLCSAGWLVLLLHRRLLDAPNFAQIRDTTLLAYVVWCVWLDWGIAKDRVTHWLIGDWRLHVLYTAIYSGLSIYACLKLNAHFNARDAVARAVIAASVLLGLVPVTSSEHMGLPVLIGHSVAFTFLLFVIFFVRVRKNLSVHVTTLFTFTYWVLAVPWAMGLPVYLGVTAMFTHMLVKDMRVKQEDPEMPEPRRAPTPPAPKPAPRWQPASNIFEAGPQPDPVARLDSRLQYQEPHGPPTHKTIELGDFSAVKY
jgi:hypothetical protein